MFAISSFNFGWVCIELGNRWSQEKNSFRLGEATIGGRKEKKERAAGSTRWAYGKDSQRRVNCFSFKGGGVWEKRSAGQRVLVSGSKQ